MLTRTFQLVAAEFSTSAEYSSLAASAPSGLDRRSLSREVGGLGRPGPLTARAFGSVSLARSILEGIGEQYPAHRSLIQRLVAADLAGVFRFWLALGTEAQQGLLSQLEGIDLGLLERNLARLSRPEGAVGGPPAASHPAASHQAASHQAASHPATSEPPDMRLPGALVDLEALEQLGEAVLENGWLAVVEGAGGTGSRFAPGGSELPKALFGISPVTCLSFLELRVARLQALRRRYGRPIPYIVMVSAATADPIRAFFERHRYFGLQDEIMLVEQRSQPYLSVIDAQHYELVLESPGKVAVGGYGHADFTQFVLQQRDVLQFLERFGTRYVQWLQIDNPLAPIGHRRLLGAHRQVEPTLAPDRLAMSFLAIEKDRPEENAGVIVRRGASLGVWEYSEMSQEARHLLRDGRQRLCYGVKRAGTVQLIAAETLLPTDVLVPREALPRWESLGLQYQYGAINPNIVVVSLDSVVRNGREVPPHLALKGCRHIDHQGQPGPASARFLKLEAFLFDGENDGAVVLEAREKCFAPTKNAEGPIDSPESARRLMHTAAVARLEGLGWEISKDRETWVELSGVLELEDAALAKVVGRGGKVGRGARLSLHGLDIRLGDGLELEPESSLVVDVSSVASLPATEPQFELPPGHRIRSGESLRRRLTASSHPGGRMGAGAGLG